LLVYFSDKEWGDKALVGKTNAMELVMRFECGQSTRDQHVEIWIGAEAIENSIGFVLISAARRIAHG
jgi:hypothetical protein